MIAEEGMAVQDLGNNEPTENRHEDGNLWIKYFIVYIAYIYLSIPKKSSNLLPKNSFTNTSLSSFLLKAKFSLKT